MFEALVFAVLVLPFIRWGGFLLGIPAFFGLWLISINPITIIMRIGTDPELDNTGLNFVGPLIGWLPALVLIALIIAVRKNLRVKKDEVGNDE